MCPPPRYRGRWCLGGGCIGAQRINRYNASLSRRNGGRTD